MGILDVINTLILVVGISFGLMLVCQTYMRVKGEEFRKNEEFEAKLVDKMITGIAKICVDTFKQLKKIDEGNGVTYSGPVSMKEKIKKQVDENFE